MLRPGVVVVQANWQHWPCLFPQHGPGRKHERPIAGQRKRYDYPRWQFTNVSSDIHELCCWALDLADIPWRQSNHKTISVSTRAGVARLDALVGLKG